MGFDRRYAAGSAILLIALALYLGTLSRGIQPGDGPELTVSSAHLGIPHPSGYPTYTMVGRLFSLIPAGSQAVRANLFAAVCGAGAVTVFGIWLLRISGSLIGALFAAGALATSLTLWRESTSAEVYSLSALFLTLLLASLPERRGDGRFPLFCYLWGLALTNHLSLVFLFIPFAVFGFTRARPNRSQFFGGVILFLLGLTPYLYLPIRSAQAPLWNWGFPAQLDPFLVHVLGQGYWGYLAEGDSWSRLVEWTGGFRREATWAGLLLVPAGAFVMRRQARDLLLLVFGGTLLSLAYTLHFHINDPEAYFLPVTILLLVPVPFAVRYLGRPRIVAVVLVLFLGAQFLSNRAECDRRTQRVLDEYINNLLMTFDVGGTVIVEGDNETFGLLYAMEGDGRRTDLTLWNSVLDLMPEGPLFHDVVLTERAPGWKRKAIRSAIAEGRPVYTTVESDMIRAEGFELRPQGLSFQYERFGEPRTGDSDSLWSLYGRESVGRVDHRSGYLTRILASLYPIQESRNLQETGELEEAARLLREAEERGEGIGVVWNSVGLAHERAGDREEAIRLFQKAAEVARDGKPRFNLARLFFDDGRMDEAEREVRWVVEKDPSLRYAGSLLLGAILVDAGRTGEAAGTYRAAWRERPGETAPLLGLAEVSLRNGHVDEAREHFRAAGRIRPGAVRDGEYRIATYFESEGRLEEAAAVYRSLAGESIYDLGAFLSLAMVRAESGAVSEADSLFDYALAIDQGGAAYNAYAWSLAMRGERLNDAIELVRESRMRDPDDPYAADTEGWILHLLADDAAAVKSLREAKRLGLSTAGLDYRLGIVLIGLNGLGEGRALLTQALLEDPASTHASEAYRLLDQSE